MTAHIDQDQMTINTITEITLGGDPQPGSLQHNLAARTRAEQDEFEQTIREIEHDEATAERDLALRFS